MFEWALLCPKLSGCLLQRHGGILVLMLRFAKRLSDLDSGNVDATVYDLAVGPQTLGIATLGPLRYVRRRRSTSTNMDKEIDEIERRDETRDKTDER
jgi:hypothetical protein